MSLRLALTIAPLVISLIVGATGRRVAAQSSEEPTRRLSRVPAPVGPQNASQELYTGSYALLVGVSKYDSSSAWASLESIPGELDRLADALRATGFDRVEQLKDPTGAELRRGVEDFIRRYGYVAGHRLVFFFSGHGYTLDRGTRGYFVPRDAPDPLKDEAAFRSVALSMQQVSTWAQDLVARHALFSFDSCFSGTIFRTRERPVPQRISEMTLKPVREFMSAGSAGEPVPARSIYTPIFIRGVKGAADLDQDGYVTGTELGNYVQREVIAYKTRQTPQFGKIRDPDLDEGDIVFAIPTRASAPPAAAVDGPLSLRWGFADVTADRAPLAVTHVGAMLRDHRLGMLMAPNTGTAYRTYWVRPDLQLTAELQSRLDGRGVATAKPLPAIKRAMYVDSQALVTTTVLGRDFTRQVQALGADLTAQLAEKNKKLAQLQAPQQQREREKLQSEIAQFTQDGQTRLQALNQRLQGELWTALLPHVDRLARAAGIDVIFSSSDAGIMYASKSLDATPLLAKMLDDGAKSAVVPPAGIPALRQAASASLQRLAAESALGKQSHAQVNALTGRNAPAAEVTELSTRLNQQFQERLRLVLDRFCAERGIDILFSQADAGFLSVDPSLDVTDAVVRALDAARDASAGVRQQAGGRMRRVEAVAGQMKSIPLLLR